MTPSRRARVTCEGRERVVRLIKLGTTGRAPSSVGITVM